MAYIRTVPAPMTLAELSDASGVPPRTLRFYIARGLMPGLAYQLGILIAAPTNSIQYALRERFGYQWALASFELVTIFTLVVILSLGTERHSRSFLRQSSE